LLWASFLLGHNEKIEFSFHNLCFGCRHHGGPGHGQGIRGDACHIRDLIQAVHVEILDQRLVDAIIQMAYGISVNKFCSRHQCLPRNGEKLVAKNTLDGAIVEHDSYECRNNASRNIWRILVTKQPNNVASLAE